MSFPKRSISIVVAAMFLVVNMSAQTAAKTAGQAPLKQQLQSKLDEWHKAGKFPGATLGIVRANGESFDLASDHADRRTKTVMKTNRRLRGGSNGKPFAAATAPQMVKEGKLGLDDKIEKYFGKEAWFDRIPNAKD